MWDNIFVYLIIALLNTVLIFFASQKFFLAMQQVGYKGYRYIKWLFSKKNQYLTRLMLLSLLGFMFFMVLAITFAPIVGRRVAPYIGFIAYIFFTVVYINAERHVISKVPLKITRRMVRLMITYVLVTFAVTLLIVLLCNAINYELSKLSFDVFLTLKYSLIALSPLLAPFVLFVAYSINKPFEDYNNKKYIERTKKVLSDTNIIKIGITGSYGKTSVKEILKAILSVKYRVLCTPKSYNTPLGISLSVKELDGTYDIYIAEMGARNEGDIKELSKIVNPDIALLTGISEQHLETFRTVENLKNTKFELFENLKDGGKAFFSIESESALELANRFKGEKYLSGTEGAFSYATDVRTSTTGVKFTLNLDGEKIDCETSLLGRHTVYNIALASAVAKKLGLTNEEISLGISRLHSVEHRLQLMPGGKGITIIDDSYNANSAGVIAALLTLDDFTGRKIIVTPGLIELGKDQAKVNYEFGKEIAKHCDLLIISAKHNAEMLIHGFTDGGKSTEDIIFQKNLVLAKQELSKIVKEGDVVLFENDLPDIYD